MSAHMLICSKMLFVLYASIVFIYRWTHRGVQPGLRAADWFVAAHLVFAAAVGTMLLEGHLRQGLALGVAVFLTQSAHLLLHLSFAGLTEDSEPWLHPQFVLFAIGIVALGWPFLSPSYPITASVVRLVSGLQYSVTGYMILRGTGRGSRFAGWVAGSAMAMFGLVHFIWFGMEVHSGRLIASALGSIPVPVNLLAHAAIAFGFLMLASSQLTVRLTREADIDELTGLMNLRALRKAAAKQMLLRRRGKEQLAVLMIDLDNMKAVNDRLGHGAGDTLLEAVSSALVEMMRKGDNLARVGGDEFCMLLPDATEDEALRLAQRSRAALADLRVLYRGEEILVSASFGVAHSTVSGWEWEELVRRGDAALYLAKSEGRNRVVVAERDKKTSVLWQIDRPRLRRRFESARPRL